MKRYFKHIKTGNIYKMLHECLECTNGRENKEYIAYVEADDVDHVDVFVRERDEFFKKFEEV
jgi:hypothetical protein